MKKLIFIMSIPALTGGLILQGCQETGTPSSANLSPESSVEQSSNLEADAADWGEFLPYFMHDTHGLKNSLVGVAKIKAGEQIHPPHRHADEEYLMVTEGRGEWYVNGETFKAEKGDILYAKPWEYHGVKAANDSPLEFVVFKFSGRGVDASVDPNPELPEELAE